MGEKMMGEKMRLFVWAVLLVVVWGCSAPTEPPESSPANIDDTVSTDVEVTGGSIQGSLREGGLKEYLAIPYAAPPLEELRWQAPQAISAWSGTHDATKRGLPCVQPGSISAFYDRAYEVTGEDCLTLNVWTRAQTTQDKLPVMVWVHGGALVMGSGTDYDGAKLSGKGVVLVTINYRLGPFGFFAHPELSAETPSGVSGNQGFKDQIAALQWVKQNITNFGGDPDNVTIFGESAGSWSMSVLQASPLSRGLFHKVIGESGARFLPLSELQETKPYAPSAEAWGMTVAAAMSGREDSTLGDLRALSAAQIMDGYASDPAMLMNFDRLTIIDGEVLPVGVNAIFAAGNQADVPVLIGSNADEATTFVPQAPVSGGELDFVDLRKTLAKQTLPFAGSDIDVLYPISDRDQARESWIKLSTDTSFTQPMRLWANHMDNVSSPAYLYWWNWRPSIEGSDQYGAFHAAEVAYVFGDLSMFDIEETQAEHEFADLMMDVWTNFAKTGNPSVDAVVDWPVYTKSGAETVVLGPVVEITNGIRSEEVELITQAFERQRSSGGE